MKILIKILTYGIALAATVGVFVAADISTKKANANQINKASEFAGGIPVTVERVRTETSSGLAMYPGVLRAACETKISSRVAGPLVDLNVKPGDVVKKGQTLIQIDQRDYKDAIAVLEAQQVSAQAQLQNARQDFQRATQLHEKQVMPQADFDQVQTALTASQAAVQAVEAQLQIANHRLEDTCIVAPYDCVIIRQNVENYEQVSAGTTLLVIQDITTLEIDIFIPENSIVNCPLVRGTKATITMPAVVNRSFEAILTEWDSSADPTSRTYKVTFSMAKPQDLQILPGMTAVVSVSNNMQDQSFLTVPASSVMTEISGKAYVWLLNTGANSAAKKYVIPGGFYSNDSLIVTDGLSADDLVVVQGQTHITENTKLNAIIIE